MNRLPRLLLLSFLAVFIIVPQAKADYVTYGFWAQSTHLWFNSDFTLQYVDYDNDAKFSLDELVPGSFSGMAGLYGGFDFFPILVDVPKHDELKSPLTDGTNWDGINTYWVFGKASGDTVRYGLNKFSCIQGPEGTINLPSIPPGLPGYVPPGGGAVPLPGAVLLLGAGLGRLVLYSRRKIEERQPV